MTKDFQKWTMKVLSANNQSNSRKVKMKNESGYRQEWTKEEADLDNRNARVQNYMIIEFVAIPPDFDIANHLSLREQAGIFDMKKINTNHLSIIADGVKASPVFSMLNNIRIAPVTCLYFLKVIHELHLVLKTLYNPLREQMDYYLKTLNEGKTSIYIKGQVAERMNFTIINIFPMMNENTINDSRLNGICCRVV